MDRPGPRRRNRRAGGPYARLTERLEGLDVVVTAARAGWANHLDSLVVVAGYDGARRLEETEPRLAWSLRLAAARVIMADMEAANSAGKAPTIEGIELDDDYAG